MLVSQYMAFRWSPILAACGLFSWRFIRSYRKLKFSFRISRRINKWSYSTMKMMYIVLLLAIVAGCAQKNENQPVQLSEEQVIARGRQLVSLGACHDCHTPKIFTETGEMKLDESRLLSGHPNGSKLPIIDERVFQPGHWTYFNEHFTAAVGMWGMTMSKNLTPHETGLKGWTPEVFIATMRTGKHMGIEHGRPVMPPMPWTNLKDLPDEDLITIFKYLQSIKPVDNYVPEPMDPTRAMTFKY